ncbi:MAG: OmpA family protein [Desulfobulbaceae bacterium]|nr:OmpA family protein [Desulfobulbaceae bacterium]
MLVKSTNTLLFVLLFLAFFISGCASKTLQPVPLDAAIDDLTKELISSLQSDSSSGETEGKDELFVVYNPFYSAGSSGVLLNMSNDIMESLRNNAVENGINIRLEMLRSANLNQADYLIKGQFIRENLPVSEPVDSKAYWHIIADIVSLSDYRQVGKAETWIIGEIDSNESPLDKDNPITIPKKQVSVERTLLEIQAKINEAREFYDNDNYENALALFDELVATKEGQIFETYVGLYLTNFMLDRQKEASKAFARLLEISIEDNNSLSCKFLFAVNKADFITDKTIRKQYMMWIKEIGAFFSASSYCIEIAGHSSHTGSESYNLKLSRQRAEKIQQHLAKYFRDSGKRTVAIGKGYSENIIGSGTDDDRDAVDRRVEYKIVECK